MVGNRSSLRWWRSSTSDLVSVAVVVMVMLLWRSRAPYAVRSGGSIEDGLRDAGSPVEADTNLDRAVP